MLNKEYVIINLISTYQDLKGEDIINLEELENGFNALATILLEDEENIVIDFSFEEALESFLELFEDCFTIDEENIILEKDLNEIYDDLLTIIEPTYFDEYLEDYMQNIAIYDAFNVPIPLDDTKDFFNMNKKIMHLYTLIAEADYKQNKNIFLLLMKLRISITKFKAMFKNLDEEMLNKLKVCISYYNSDSKGLTSPFVNASWYNLLFSKDYSDLTKLTYEKTEYYYNVAYYEYISQDTESLENVDDENLSELSYFLTHFLILLNNYLKTLQESSLKSSLTMKKYLLLSEPELEHLETYLLNNLTIDHYICPKKELTETSFEILHRKIMECVLDLDYSDNSLTKNPYLYENLIIKALFIKCYLDLNINTNRSKEVIDTILTSKYYNDKNNYSTIYKLIEDTIFKKEELIPKR